MNRHDGFHKQYKHLNDYLRVYSCMILLITFNSLSENDKSIMIYSDNKLLDVKSKLNLFLSRFYRSTCIIVTITIFHSYQAKTFDLDYNFVPDYRAVLLHTWIQLCSPLSNTGWENLENMNSIIEFKLVVNNWHQYSLIKLSLCDRLYSEQGTKHFLPILSYFTNFTSYWRWQKGVRIVKFYDKR